MTKGTFLGVRRKGKDLEIFIDPEILPGEGALVRLSAEAAALGDFFAFKPR